MVIGIQWDESFSLGFEPLDEQHKQIFGVTEEIDQMLQASAPRDAVIEQFVRLRGLLSEHFAYENTLAAGLDGVQYPFNAHRACHEKVLRDVEGVIALSIGVEI